MSSLGLWDNMIGIFHNFLTVGEHNTFLKHVNYPNFALIVCISVLVYITHCFQPFYKDENGQGLQRREKH